MKFRNLIAMILALSLLLCVALPASATPRPLYSPEYFYHIGDMNQDMCISTEDVTLVLQVAVGKLELTPFRRICADIDRDGKVNSTDACKLLQYTVKKYEGAVWRWFLIDENNEAVWYNSNGVIKK